MKKVKKEALFRRFLRYFLPGALIGLGVTFFAAFSELVRFGKDITLSNLFEQRAQLPVIMLVLAPFMMGVIGWFFGTLGERRARENKLFSARLLEKQKQLEQRNQRLQELNEALDGLVYNASHALKNPVVNFQSMIEMLKILTREPGNEVMIQEVIERLESASGKFLFTISDLVDVSRVEKQLREEAERLAIEDCVKDSFSELSESMEVNHAEIYIETDKAPSIIFSAPGLKSIFQNLLSNAVKYSHPDRKPEVRVFSKRIDEGLQIEVSDNGMGINLEVFRDKLFKMFSKLNQDQEGNGIGLYIVKRTVELAGGKIWVESEEGKGTTFFLRFPKTCIPQN